MRSRSYSQSQSWSLNLPSLQNLRNSPPQTQTLVLNPLLSTLPQTRSPLLKLRPRTWSPLLQMRRLLRSLWQSLPAQMLSRLLSLLLSLLPQTQRSLLNLLQSLPA